jgi:hypothetical protein
MVATLALVGGLAAIVGTILPWAKVATAANAANSQIGASFFDGKIFILLGVLAIVSSGAWLASEWLPANILATVVRLLGTGPWISILAGGYIVLYGILDLRDISDQVSRQASGLAAVGPGIYLDIAAGIAILASGAIGLLARRRRPGDTAHPKQ